MKHDATHTHTTYPTQEGGVNKITTSKQKHAILMSAGQVREGQQVKVHNHQGAQSP